MKFPGTSVPFFHNPSALDDEFDDSEAPMLSSIVVDEDDIDFDIDWFIDNNISMERRHLVVIQLVKVKRNVRMSCFDPNITNTVKINFGIAKT